jgi:Sulfotransferase family
MRASAEALIARGAVPARVPNFFIVGHPKGGTTALYEMLRRHPQIYMPELKEPRFFDRELHAGLRQTATHPDTLDEYLALFNAATPEQRAGEASPDYLRSQMAARRIAELEPEARIIAILREPASFLRSMHLELLKDHVETEKDLRKAIAREEHKRRASEIQGVSNPDGFRYTAERVQYVQQLGRFHAVFPREQVLVLIYDDFRADNEGTLRQVLRFLDVDDTLAIDAVEVNPTVRVRSPRLYSLVRSLYLGRGPLGGAAKAAIKALTPQRLRDHGLRALRRRILYGGVSRPDEELMLELRRRFKGEVVALSEYLDRDLVTLWGYDKIG